jgi:hypothetical protein
MPFAYQNANKKILPIFTDQEDYKRNLKIIKEI